ncbi:hypothetical protein ACFXKC_50725 [Streptomyces sp. NPDC059340]|uniref:hypothetical protein n=1 Tax=Streptomyces sp. NPDC059340 TaxID=3346806 RepID=UPI003679F7FB
MPRSTLRALVLAAGRSAARSVYTRNCAAESPRSWRRRGATLGDPADHRSVGAVITGVLTAELNVALHQWARPTPLSAIRAPIQAMPRTTSST